MAAVCSQINAEKSLIDHRNSQEKDWALKRDWTDCNFQSGHKSNKEQLESFENILVQRLRRSCARASGQQDSVECLDDDHANDGAVILRGLKHLRNNCRKDQSELRDAVLNEPEVLGSALDIVGAYLKNYELDKAAAVIETIIPLCRKRGSLWLLKALNFLSTVRMKQARPAEALEILQEIESQVANQLTEEESDEAWEFFETIYRNFGWVLSSLHREMEAMNYIQRSIDVKKKVGKEESWFDKWDLGRIKATKAMRGGMFGQGVKIKLVPEEIKECQELVTKALWMHKEAEPHDRVMRAKIWHNVGECSFALGHIEEIAVVGCSTIGNNPNSACQVSSARTHYRKSLKCFREAHKLFKTTEGHHHPLTGSEAQAVAWVLLKLDEPEESKQFLGDALETLARQQSGWGDGDSLEGSVPALSQATMILDRILESHRRTGDREGLAKHFAGIAKLCANVHRRVRLSKERDIAAVYEKMVSSGSMVMIACGSEEGVVKSQELIRKYMWSSPATPQAQLCTELLTSLRNGENPANIDGPGVKALTNALVCGGH